MKILSIDTCSSQGSLALIEDKKVLHISSWSYHEKKHSEKLISLIEDLKEHLSSLTHLAVTLGPGSFTGIRIGMNVAKTIAYSFNLPLYGFHFLEIMASSFLDENKKVLSLLNAQKNQLFAALYQKNKTLLEPQVINLNNLPSEALYFVGRDLEKFEFPSSWKRIHEKEPIALTMTSFLSKGKLKTFETLLPIYIRPSSAEENLANHEKK